ncbi:M3 family metallopeptidase [Silvibacterium dinghuense]|uniref:Peptidase M3 n=1 Tax=Silvibacterium dinghuense TaxID=1560006 RepID=A0A4Q1SIX0_9BACT|nr:M3 family metallopeptidase [Silvibacterium dinghuense]RXS97363.1 peptidase M3 [Silvibacterium dinghuense]GGG98387.1 oligopeptidase A [Silvibacterium dinghuense]
MTETTLSPHPWNLETRADGSASPEALEAWVQARLVRHRDAIARLLAVPGPRTVENTLRPYDDAVAELSATATQTGLLDSVHPQKEIRDKAQALAQVISQAGVELGLNQAVYQALNEIDSESTDAATQHYLKRTLLQYRLAGVDKDEATRTRLRELQDKATVLALTFGRNVQENVNTVVVEDAAELDGLPADYLAAHPAGEDGKITLTTDYPDYLPVMTFAKSAKLRRSMYLAFNTRAFPQNREVLLDLLKIRKEIAGLLGFKTWADLATADQMMGSAENMRQFLEELDTASRAGAEKEFAMIAEFARVEQKLESNDAEIDAASRGYWLEQYRRAAFEFDSQSVRPYFPYDRVEQGVLSTAARLFQVEFRPVADAPVWHPDVVTYDVYDRDTQIGRFYLDMHPREGKDKWFSAHPLIPGIVDHPDGRQIPEAALICNFPGGPSSAKTGDPGLMQHSDVVTYFHEFGHLMHALLGGHQSWAGLSGIATEGDFVEVPSQMLEEFFRDPRLLATFALHYETDEPIPAELVLRMNRAGAFGRADWVRTQLFYTTYSLETHALDPETLDLDHLLHSLYARFLPYVWIDGNRMYASFTHLVGYSSNYYTYLYDKVIALDFFAQFARTNLLDDPIAMKYRRTVLEPGGSMPGEDIVLRFLGRRQSADAFVHWVGEEFQAAATVYE